MNIEELSQLKSRVKAYEDAKNDLHRYEKLQKTLDAIPDGDHTIGSIIVDVQKPEFRYESDKSRVGLNICSMEKADHEELFDLFLEWARGAIKERVDKAREAMDEA